MNASAAYRADVQMATGPFSDSDGDRVLVASLMQQAVALPERESADLYSQAVHAAARLVKPSAAVSAADHPHMEAAKGADILLALAESIEDSGALNLAACLLETLGTGSAFNDALSRGRALAQRARVAWKLGNLDEAQARYDFVDSLGKRNHLEELRARAALGKAALAQMRGNYPEMMRHAKRAARRARRAGTSDVERTAIYAAIRSAVASGDFDRAVRVAWQMYSDAQGNEERAGEALQTLGQLFFDQGQIEAARAALSIVMQMRLPARVLLPAVGGLAMASAYAGAEPTVEWTVREITRLPASASPRYAVCSALMECATALRMLGRREEAVACADRALALAARHGFHELVYRAELLMTAEPQHAPVASPRPIGASAARVIQRLETIRPDRLPAHLMLAPAGV